MSRTAYSDLHHFKIVKTSSEGVDEIWMYELFYLECSYIMYRDWLKFQSAR